MNDIAALETCDIARLDSLAAEARACIDGIALNMIQLGRVYTEAKKLVKHGEWQSWVRSNGGMSERSAQQLMAAYARFGSDTAYQSIEKSKLFKMLALPPGKEAEFMEQNDVSDMTSRQVEEAVRKAREEAQTALSVEREAREKAEQRVKELEEAPPTIPEEMVDSIREKEAEASLYKQEFERIKETAKDAISASMVAVNENNALLRDLKETEEMLADKQREYDALQAQLLNYQSAAAKELTLPDFSAAVRQFIGTVARMPHMRGAFSTMPAIEREEYDVLLRTVESWAVGARSALDTVEGVLFDG
jgi:hypothetical protein